MSHWDGAGEQLLVDVVGRDGHLADVVEEVVEQDLRRQHRQEGEEQRGAGGGEHVAEVRRGAHQDVLDRVGEDAPALDDTVGDDAEVLVEQDDVGGVLGDVGRGVDGDADVGVVEGDRVVDAVAEEADVGAEAALREDDARLLLRRDAGEDGRLRQQREQGGVVQRRELGPVTTVPGSRPTSRQRCAATWPLSPVTILTVMPRRSRRASDSLTSGLAGSEKQRKPSSERSRSSSWLRCSAVSGRLATATTRAPEANSPSSVACASAGTCRAAGEDALRGRPWRSAVDPAASRRGPRRAAARGRRAGGRASARRSSPWAVLRRGPERAVELVAGLVAAGQAERMTRGRPACRRSRAPA